MTDSFFTTNDNHWFTPTAHSRGPWSEHHCHAGPPTGLAARAAELLFPDQRLTRLTINLMRPIPHAGFFVESIVIRKGRSVSLSKVTLQAEDGQVFAQAEGLHMTEQTDGKLAASGFLANDESSQQYGTPEDALPGRFPITEMLHGQPGFNGDGVETRYPIGQTPDPGSTIAWLKTVPLLATETPSPFQRICPLADCGNAFSRRAEPWQVNFMNPDLTLLLFRDPVGDWLGSDSTGHWQSNGIGLADATLFDKSGIVGRAMQTLLLRTVESDKPD